MRKLGLLILIVALSGCAAMHGRGILALETGCDAGSLRLCRNLIRYHVDAGTRTHQEALADFQVRCAATVRRHKLDPSECEKTTN